MRKFEYSELEFEVVTFGSEDVITTSVLSPMSNEVDEPSAVTGNYGFNSKS